MTQAEAELMRARSSIVFVALLAFGCATQSLPHLATRRSLELVREKRGTLAWAGIRLGMRPAEVRNVLGRRFPRRHDKYVDVCGEYFSVLQVAGRKITIQWSSADATAEVESIGVPLAQAERVMSDVELSQLARASVPTFIDAVAVEYDLPPAQHPTSFVLARNHGAALLIKPDDPENNLWVTLTACID